MGNPKPRSTQGDGGLASLGCRSASNAGRRVSCLGTPHGVEFRGTVAPDELTEPRGGARALLVPTRWNEGGPKSVIEAFAAGVPVVATGLGALPEVIEDGVSGKLVPPGMADVWVEAVEDLSDDGTAARHGEGALKRWARMRCTRDGEICELC